MQRRLYYKIIYLLPFLLNACEYANNPNYSNNIKYFKDFDFFSLSGNNELNHKQLNTPYVSVILDANQQSQAVTFHFSEKIEFTKKILSNNKFKYSIRSIEDTDRYMYYVDVFNKNNILQYQFWGNPIEEKEAELVSVSVLKKDGIKEEFIEEIYSFAPKPKITIQITNDINQVPLKRAISKITNRIFIKKGKLYYEYNLKGSASERTDCFVLDQLSYFWWTYIGHYLDKCSGKNTIPPGEF